MPEQDLMQEVMKTAQLGKEHQMLARHVGEWNLVMRAWMTSQDEKPMEGRATAVIKSLVSGRCITEELTGNFGDMPFEGFGTMGHNNFHRKYWQTWTDWMTGCYYGEGPASPDPTTITMYGKEDRPEMGRTNVERRTVYHFLNDNQYTFEVFEKGPDGREFRTLEIEYRRKK